MMMKKKWRYILYFEQRNSSSSKNRIDDVVGMCTCFFMMNSEESYKKAGVQLC